MSKSSNNHVAFVTDSASRIGRHGRDSNEVSNTSAFFLPESSVDNQSEQTAVQATSSTIDDEVTTRKSPAGEGRNMKTPRALLPRHRPADTETHPSITSPNGSKVDGAGATTSTSSKAKITIVACQECQRKKCKVHLGFPFPYWINYRHTSTLRHPCV